MRTYLEKCHCGSGLSAHADFDGYGIFLFYACDKCREKKIKQFRRDIFERYECDEPIEAD
jgi:hypothetical protein